MALDKPGDGKTSPFGDGAGGAGMASGGGNDFTKNPNPSGGKGGGVPPTHGVSRPQQSGSDQANSADAAPGPSTAAEVVTPTEVGGTQGVAHKPFKLGAG